jgi:hypothetical protein
MTIAYWQVEGVGARVYLPEGPFGAAGQTPLPSFRPGEVIAGDAEAEFVYLIFSPTAAVTVNQGDVFMWDNSYRATLLPAAAAGALTLGNSWGTFFLGGRVGDPAAAPAAGDYWSYTFPSAGNYGIWVQRAGTSLIKVYSASGTIAAGKVVSSTAVVGAVDSIASGWPTNSQTSQGGYLAPTSLAFTANTTNGSTTLTNVSNCRFLVVGQTLSGTGIPNGTVITDIQGTTISMSLAATATNTGTSITAANMSTWGTTVNGSAVVTGVTSIAGIYPNQTISGTGIPANTTTIVSITGNSAPYTITLSAAATASGTVNLTTTVPAATYGSYYEAYLRWPYGATQN